MLVTDIKKIKAADWEKTRVSLWKEKVSQAMKKPPKDYLSSLDDFNAFLDNAKKQGYKINLKIKAFQEGTKKAWEEYRKEMWAKKMNVFKGPMPSWFLDRKATQRLLADMENTTSHKLKDYTNMKKTKILVVSDTHTSMAWKDLIAKEKPDIAIHVGDFEQFNHPGFSVSNEEKNKYFQYWVNGNHEITSQMLKLNLNDDYFLAMYDQYKTFKIQGKTILLTHFFEEEDRVLKTTNKRTGQLFNVYEWKKKLLAKIKPDYVITGHTHIGHINKEKGYTIINPGSPVISRLEKDGKIISTYVIGYAQGGKFNWKVVKNTTPWVSEIKKGESAE